MGPLIAVPARRVGKGKVDGWPRTSAVAAPVTYIEALHRAGGQEAVLLPAELAEDEAQTLISRFDGLLLMGGGDIDPALYGQAAEPEVYGVNELRDSFEIALLRAAIASGVPTLAICRGMQVLNVALGGSLKQHIGKERAVDHGTMDPHGWVRHQVKIRPGSLVEQAMGVSTADCSSHHHQAVADLGHGLSVTAEAADGIIEAVELQGAEWVVGVQWHPEVDADTQSVHQRLFDSLVERSSAFREASGPRPLLGRAP